MERVPALFGFHFRAKVPTPPHISVLQEPRNFDAASIFPPLTEDELPRDETLACTGDVYQTSGIEEYVRRIIKMDLARQCSELSKAKLPGELGYISPTFENMLNRTSMTKIMSRIGARNRRQYEEALEWRPMKPDRRRLFGVPIIEQLTAAPLDFIVTTPFGQNVLVHLPVLPALFLYCLLTRKSVAFKETLFRDNFGNHENDDLFLINYVDERSYGNVDRYGESHALKNADTLFKYWLRALPDSLIPVELFELITVMVRPYCHAVEQDQYHFGSPLPAEVVHNLRLVLQILRSEEKALLFAIINTCIPVIKNRGFRLKYFTGMLSPNIIRVMRYQSPLDSLYGNAFLTMLFIACNTFNNMFDMIPRWAVDRAIADRNLAAERNIKAGRTTGEKRGRDERDSAENISAMDAECEDMDNAVLGIAAGAEAGRQRPSRAKKQAKMDFRRTMKSPSSRIAEPTTFAFQPSNGMAASDNFSFTTTRSIASSIRSRLFTLGKK